MQYREFGTTGKMLSGLGWGVNLFAPEDLRDQAGLERAAELLVDGVKQGINYIDCGRTYSMGKGEEIVALALKELRRGGYSCYTSSKVKYREGPTVDLVRRHLELSLRKMGVNQVTFGFAWHVASYDEFTKMMRPGGLYEGLAKAKEEGLIEHICFSSHASVEDTVQIIESGCFDGCTISCNILNVDSYKKVFNTAKKRGIGIFTMNSLGNGVIPRLGASAGAGDASLVKAALAELYAHEEITTCLSSMQNKRELYENLSAFQAEHMSVPLSTQWNRSEEPFCTKCQHCTECPVGLPISKIMYAYNNLTFSDLTEGYGKYKMSAPEQLFNPRFCDYITIPESEINPCLHCGKCEQKCTQGLPIMEKIDRFYQEAAKGCYTKRQRRERLEEKIRKNSYKSICFFPAGDYTKWVIEDYLRFFGDLSAEVCISDNNRQLWGQRIAFDGREIQIVPPQELDTLRPDLILVTSFFFGEEIYQRLLTSELAARNIRIEKLHRPGDVPWY